MHADASIESQPVGLGIAAVWSGGGGAALAVAAASSRATTAAGSVRVMPPRRFSRAKLVSSGDGEDVRVRTDPLAAVERRDPLHLVVGELEPGHVEVLGDPGWGDRLRDDHAAELEMPADDNLTGRAIVGLGDL